jgi:drug/metabolite transporter (DMT)-like permease
MSADSEAEPTRHQPSSWQPAISIGYAAVVLIWGTTWYGIHTQVNGTAPHVGVALRMAAASVIFFAIAVAARQPLQLTVAHYKLIGVQGLCFFGLNYLAVYTAAQYLTSGVVAVMISVTVPLNLFVEWAIYGARPKFASVLAAAVGMCGISLVFSGELSGALADRSAAWGAGLVLIAAALVAVGNVVSAHLMSERLSWISVNALGMAVGCAAVLCWGAVSGATWELQVDPSWLGGYAYLVLIGSVTAFGIYMKILPAVGTTAAAYTTVLAPVVALIISALLEGFELHPKIYVGVILLLLGHTLLITRRAPHR